MSNDQSREDIRLLLEIIKADKVSATANEFANRALLYILKDKFRWEIKHGNTNRVDYE